MGSGQKSCATTRTSSKRSSRRHSTDGMNPHKVHNSCVDFSFLPQTTNSQKLVKLNAIFERAADKRTGGIREDKLKRMIPAGVDRYSFLARKRKRNASSQQSSNSQTHQQQQSSSKDDLRIVSRGPFLAMFAHESMSFLNTLAMNEKIDRERKVQSRRSSGSRASSNSGGRKNSTSNTSGGKRDVQSSNGSSEQRRGSSSSKKGSSSSSRGQKYQQEENPDMAQEKKGGEKLDRQQNEPQSNSQPRRGRANTAPSESSTLFFPANEGDEIAASDGPRDSPEKSLASPYDCPSSPLSPQSTSSSTVTDGGWENSWDPAPVYQVDSSSYVDTSTSSKKPDKTSKKSSSNGKRRSSTKESRKRQSSSRSLQQSSSNSNGSSKYSQSSDVNNTSSDFKEKTSSQQNGNLRGSKNSLVLTDVGDSEKEEYDNAHKENCFLGYSPYDGEKSWLGDEHGPQMPLLDGGGLPMTNLTKRSFSKKSSQGAGNVQENEVLQSLSIEDNRMNHWSVPSHVVEAAQMEEHDSPDLRKALTHPFPPQILAPGGVVGEEDGNVDVVGHTVSDMAAGNFIPNRDQVGYYGHVPSGHEKELGEEADHFRHSNGVFDASSSAHGPCNVNRRFEDEASAWTLSSYSVSSDEGDGGELCVVPPPTTPSLHGPAGINTTPMSGATDKRQLMIHEEGRSMSDQKILTLSSEKDGRALTSGNGKMDGNDADNAQECVMLSCVSTFLKKVFPALFGTDAAVVRVSPPSVRQARRHSNHSWDGLGVAARTSRRAGSPSAVGLNQHEQKTGKRAPPQSSVERDLMHAQFPGRVRRATSDSSVRPGAANGRSRMEPKRARLGSGSRERRNSGGGGRHSNFDSPFGEQQRSATRRRSSNSNGYSGGQRIGQQTDVQQNVGGAKPGSSFGDSGLRRRSTSNGTVNSGPKAFSGQLSMNGDFRLARPGSVTTRG